MKGLKLSSVFRTKWFLLLWMLVGIGIAKADSNEELFIQANKDYSAGLYENAIAAYRQIMENGFESAELYYNLGNAYFKSNDIPSAILFYEKAGKLKPNDPDIAFNLNVANSRIKDKIEAVPVMFYIRWWNGLVRMLSPDAWTKIHIILFFGFLLCIGLYFLSGRILWRKIAFWSATMILFLSLVIFGLAFQHHRLHQQVTEAIVFDPSLTVKSSPSENSVDLFVIHEGTKVTVTDKLVDWYEIRIANGSAGWIPQASVKNI